MSSTQAKYSPELFFASFDVFEEGDCIGALRKVLDSNNPDISQKYANADGIHYRIPHGSVIIDIRVTPEGTLEAEIPFMRVPEKNGEAVLRFILSTDFGPFKTGIDNDDQIIYFCYREPARKIKEDTAEEICSNIVDFCREAVTLSARLIEVFGCLPSNYSKNKSDR